MRPNKSGRLLALALITTSLAFSTAAPATAVHPVVVDLNVTGNGASQTINVENTGATPLPVEIVVEELAFDESGARATARSSDLRIFPTQAVIQAGRSQAFRVQWAGDPALARGKSYYVTVAQVPVQLPQGQSAIQVLYNFQVLVSVAPNNAQPNLRVESASIGRDPQNEPVPVIMVSNDSATHAYLSRGTLSLVVRDAQGHTAFQRTLSPSDLQQSVGFGLVAPGQRRSVMLPITLPSGAGSLEARFLPASR
jgi:P pilus assembly chaperone PapD